MRVPAESLPDPDDAALISATCEGDGTAFEELFRRYQSRILDLCLRLVGDRGWAEDLTQETLLRAFLNLPNFDTRRAFWPWLSKVARNLCIDDLRSRGRHPLCYESETLDEIEPTTGEDLTFEEVVVRDDRTLARGRLSRALTGLSPRERLILMLREGEGWSHEEIAQFEGSSVNAVRNVAWRARRLIRFLLLEEDRGAVDAPERV